MRKIENEKNLWPNSGHNDRRSLKYKNELIHFDVATWWRSSQQTNEKELTRYVQAGSLEGGAKRERRKFCHHSIRSSLHLLALYKQPLPTLLCTQEWRTLCAYRWIDSKRFPNDSNCRKVRIPQLSQLRFLTPSPRPRRLPLEGDHVRKLSFGQ